MPKIAQIKVWLVGKRPYTEMPPSKNPRVEYWSLDKESADSQASWLVLDLWWQLVSHEEIEALKAVKTEAFNVDELVRK